MATPDTSPADSLLPPHGGLTPDEAAQRAAAGEANVDTSQIRTDGDVIRSNALSFFNVVLVGLIIALFAVGGFRDGFFVSIVIVANIVVGTFQEIRAGRALRKLVALTAPKAAAIRDGRELDVLAEEVVRGDLLHLRPGDQVVADGRIISRECEIDESLITGESDSIKKSEVDELRSGSFCTAGDCYYTAELVGLAAYAQKLTADARVLVKRATPLQDRVQRIVRVLLTATAALATLLMISFNVEDRGFTESVEATAATVTSVVPIGLLLGITVAFAVGAVRVSRSGAIVQDINAVEALNYTDVICLDKTGTITANMLTLAGTDWFPGKEREIGWLATFASASRGDSKTAEAMADEFSDQANGAVPAATIPFSSARRWSAISLRLGSETRHFVLGAPETLLPHCSGAAELPTIYANNTERGLRGVLFAEAPSLPDADTPLPNLEAIALLSVADVLRPEVGRAFELMKELEIEPKLISGDNPHTVASLLRQLDIEISGGVVSGSEIEALDEAGFAKAVAVNSVFGRVAPPLKARIVQALRDQGHFVAMVGDGANDVQALRSADVAVAMASGTGTARAVSGIILLNDSFEALIRGAKEATAVLGNTARLNKLFIAKSLYAFLLIVSTTMLGLDFPFLPRHGSLTALLTLGIPAVFISISIPPPGSGRDFTRNVMQFAIPASLAVASAAIIVHLMTQGVLQRDIEEARTLVSLTIGITGLFLVVEVLGFEGASFKSLTRPVLTTVLGLLLLAALVLTVYTPSIRSFFEFTEVKAFDWTLVIVASSGALAGQFLITRYWQNIINVLIATPRNESERGRAT
ncbi:MAG TPA: HAD-IC family P-type ATPase [Dehalococcoidia bacterium]|nr:HAD-IC family P-type ATPase [Dehalococcoidia bacterium]